MTFAKKFLETVGETKTIEVNKSQIDAAILTYLSAMKVLNYKEEDLYTLEFFPGEKSDKLVRLKIIKRKEV